MNLKLCKAPGYHDLCQSTTEFVPYPGNVRQQKCLHFSNFFVLEREIPVVRRKFGKFMESGNLEFTTSPRIAIKTQKLRATRDICKVIIREYDVN